MILDVISNRLAASLFLLLAITFIIIISLQNALKSKKIVNDADYTITDDITDEW
jgi:hypothetical protein